jgi:predicted NAD/FAD-binding protein
MKNKKRIAIIGSGISGLSASYFLKDECEINLYEKDNRLGGHSRTIAINTENDNKIDVDTGFIVLNDRTYRNLIKLFDNLGIELSKTEMTFAISANNGELEWSGTSIDSMFAMRKNIFNPHMLRGIFDILKFNKNAVNFVQQFPGITLGDLIAKMNLKSWFKDYYILPMGGAIWSCSAQKMMDFPASTFVNFFDNHGLLSINNRPQWYTLKDKSISYVNVLRKLIEDKHQIIPNAKIESIKRTETGVEIKESEKVATYYDEVIFAAHPVEILSIIKDASPEEKSILEKFSRQKNTAYTHCDPGQMPKLKKCWSSWNYLYRKDSKESTVSVTYWMNKLQHIDENYPIFVTLNPINPIPEDKTYDINEFYHPVFDKTAIEAQKAIDNIQGKNKLWFCGAYLRYGFHEDGIWSALNVLSKMNINR